LVSNAADWICRLSSCTWLLGLFHILDEIRQFSTSISGFGVSQFLDLTNRSLTLLTWLLVVFVKQKAETPEQLPILVERHLDSLLVIILH
jgi:hypothetical protein